MSLRTFALVVLAIAACGGNDGISPALGASCRFNADCVDKCVPDSAEFPGGFCTKPCVSDLDCPIEAACIASNGGVCAFRCSDFDCPRLGPGYNCYGKALAMGGTAQVCTGR